MKSGTHTGSDNKRMPKGVPDHVFNFPEIYGAEECGKYKF